MKLNILTQTALRGIAANKVRTVLTMLGIVIGVLSIMLIMSLGNGANALIQSQIQGLGSRTLVVIPGREPKGPSDSGQMFSDSLKERDFIALQNKSNVPTIARISPAIFGGETAEFDGETFHITVFGANEQIGPMFSMDLLDGRMINNEDVKSRADVAVLGSNVAEELFATSEGIIGKKIKMKGRGYTVVGVLPKKGQLSFFNFDDTAIVPYTNAQSYLFGITYFHRFMVEAVREDDIDSTVADIRATLRNTHSIDDPEKEDFHVHTQADLASIFGTVTSVLTTFLSAIAAISLVVGGIGIMNIMLVSVTERTHEIGLRKALGATSKDIRNQFLLESVLLTVSGGLIGVIVGSLLSFVIAFGLRVALNVDWHYAFPLSAAILGITVSIVIGGVFGWYPARNAASKQPVEALRYE